MVSDAQDLAYPIHRWDIATGSALNANPLEYKLRPPNINRVIFERYSRLDRDNSRADRQDTVPRSHEAGKSFLRSWPVVYPEATLQDSRRTRNWPNGRDLIADRYSSMTVNPTFERASCFDLIHKFLPRWSAIKRNLKLGGEETAKRVGLITGQNTAAICKEARRFFKTCCHLALRQERHYSQLTCDHLNTSYHTKRLGPPPGNSATGKIF